MPNCISSLSRGHSKLPEQGAQTAMLTITVSPASCSQLIPLVVSRDRAGVLHDQIKEKKTPKLCIQMNCLAYASQNLYGSSVTFPLKSDLERQMQRDHLLDWGDYYLSGALAHIHFV